MGKIDLTNQKFGRLTVLFEAPKRNKKIYWHCKCDCGNECDVYGYDLRRGHTQSCGCLVKEKQLKSHMLDLTNQKFGKLTALYPNWEYSKDKKGIYWHCKCDCGSECDVSANNLSQKHTQSCGCLKTEILIERNIKDREVKIGNQYGFLTVIGDAGYEIVGTTRKHFSYCFCNNCNKTNIKIRDNYLQSGSVISCGCIHESLGEKLIVELLTNNNLFFEREKKFFNFEDTNQPARYDFYVDNKYIIEFDGIQHFEITGGWNTQEHFEKVQEHDQIKNQWCKDNNIPLIRIPYTHLDELCLEDLIPETSKFLIKGDS